MNACPPPGTVRGRAPLIVLLGAAQLWLLPVLGAGLPGAERERNFWPFHVQQLDAGGDVQAWNAAGPLVFSRRTAEGPTVQGVRPFWIQTTGEDGEPRTALGLYPLFTWTGDEETFRWNVFQLVRHHGRRAGAPPAVTGYGEEAFEVWPFWWSRETGDPDTSYHALLPVAGTLRRRLGFEQVSWAPFPFYVRTTVRGATTTHTPWPFVRVTRGAARGFGVWPLFGRQERPGVSRDAFFLWPLGYDRRTDPPPDAPSDTPPTRDFGALPFYTRSSGPGYRSENYLWPFFGYTERTAPVPYQETRYFWPFLVQGRGEDRHVNRWGPFYTHSVRNGYDKTWIAWPLYRRVEHVDEELTQTKQQVGIFLYWSLAQRRTGHPEIAAASVRHLWPVFSAWDNGAGHRQFQFPSPLEVFFPGNERMRHAWTPLFSLYRQESRAPGHFRASLLWNGVTWERDVQADRKEFHLGPLLTYARDAQGMRFEFARGLFGTTRDDRGRGWRLFWFNLPGTRAARSHRP